MKTIIFLVIVLFSAVAQCDGGLENYQVLKGRSVVTWCDAKTTTASGNVVVWNCIDGKMHVNAKLHTIRHGVAVDAKDIKSVVIWDGPTRQREVTLAEFEQGN